MRNLILAATLCAALSWGGPAAAASYIVTASNLRSEPRVSPLTLVHTLPAGTQIAVLGEDNRDDTKWLKVVTDAETGWLRANLVRDEPTATTPGARTAKEAPDFSSLELAAGETVTNANLRTQPGLRPRTRIRTLPQGTPVTIEGEQFHRGSRWLRVRAGGDAGWIRADLVRLHPHLEGDSPTLTGDEPEAELSAVPEALRPIPAAVPAEPGRTLASALSPSRAEAAITTPPATGERPPQSQLLLTLRDSQVLLAALIISFVLLRAEHRMGQRLAPSSDLARLRAGAVHVENALSRPGTERDYDRLLSALYAVERLLLPGAKSKSVLDQLTELVAAVNTTPDGLQRVTAIEAVRKRMLDAGVLAILSRAFAGVDGYTFNDDLHHKIRAFLAAALDSVEPRFEEIRQPTRLCFNDLSQRLIVDTLHSTGVTLLFGRRLDLLQSARETARTAASRGWTGRDVASVRQTVVYDLLAPAA